MLAVSSARDAWIFPVRAAHVGSSYYAYNYALRWDGTAWHASRFPGKLIVQAVAALGPADVWAFGAIYRNSYTLVPDTARYDGRSWHRVHLPAEPLTAAAAGRDDLWAIGPTAATAARIPRRQDIIALHFNGRTWSTLAVPKLALPPGPANAIASSLAVAGPRSLWWYYQVAGLGAIGATQHLLHWNGTAWHAITLPAPIGRVDALTQDGHGGIWLTADPASFSQAQYWYHYASGRWTRQRIPSPKGYLGFVTGMAWIPRTRSVWADGEADPNSSHGRTIGVIAKYGP